ncbi:hypothetical protein BEWA_043200 [Theileria equi strain WA]|uniref:Uncharacterized protein n=1 Tax=Theileria equi strain WA TaxID=1537102 RepID=L1LG92_THEEQ|nr:hypothetical protein BEWA_043200 [Theileria equi strain WA]EKX74279.1 hypothetical protein BEWA_043200 [Theileria equi strain WA]|eukprot:XP_004833731.1 hypothetical protein BEWA_043200 [Theileria equi strain WA]
MSFVSKICTYSRAAVCANSSCYLRYKGFINNVDSSKSEKTSKPLKCFDLVQRDVFWCSQALSLHGFVYPIEISTCISEYICKNKRNRLALRKKRKRMGERISLRYR